MQMVAEGRPAEKWSSLWLRWRRGFHQANAVAANPALWRPYITHLTVSNKFKVRGLNKQLETFVILRVCFCNPFSTKPGNPLVLIVLLSAANSKYYKLLIRSGQDERRNATVCSLEELERVTSEHTLKNTVHTHITHTHTNSWYFIFLP